MRMDKMVELLECDFPGKRLNCTKREVAGELGRNIYRPLQQFNTYVVFCSCCLIGVGSRGSSNRSESVVRYRCSCDHGKEKHCLASIEHSLATTFKAPSRMMTLSKLCHKSVLVGAEAIGCE